MKACETSREEVELLRRSKPAIALLMTIMAVNALVGIWFLPALGFPEAFGWVAGSMCLVATTVAIANGAVPWARYLLRRSPGSVAFAGVFLALALAITLIIAKFFSHLLG